MFSSLLKLLWLHVRFWHVRKTTWISVELCQDLCLWSQLPAAQTPCPLKFRKYCTLDQIATLLLVAWWYLHQVSSKMDVRGKQIYLSCQQERNDSYFKRWKTYGPCSFCLRWGYSAQKRQCNLSHWWLSFTFRCLRLVQERWSVPCYSIFSSSCLQTTSGFLSWMNL